MDLLGKKVKCSITDLVGTVTSVAYYLTSNTKVLVECTDTTGRPIEWWVDLERVKVIEVPEMD